MNTKTVFTGSILAALFASLCCIGPIAFAGLGVTSVALGVKFEPLRPYFLTLTGIFLAFGFLLRLSEAKGARSLRRRGMRNTST